MNLVIDIGNTRSKFAVFNGEELIFENTYDTDSIAAVSDLLKKHKQINQAIIASTGYAPFGLSDYLHKKLAYVLEFTQKTPVPFKSKYKTPDTIGLDRLAAVAGTQAIFPGKNTLIIDAGTAIKYDILTSMGIHLGGNISPGLKMRARALHDYTKSLPLIELDNAPTLLGQSTHEAILNGIVNGMVYEIESTIDKNTLIYKDLTILLTGGDAEFFENKLKKTIFVIPNLICNGLNIILNHNATNI